MRAIIAVLLLAISASTQESDNLRAYIACALPPKFAIEESSERSEPFLRPIALETGEYSVHVAHGYSLHITYDETPFVNFKAERLTAAEYSKDKAALIESLGYAASHSHGMSSNLPDHSSRAGFDIYNINSSTLVGKGVLDLYILFRDADKTVVTLYLLNTPPEEPKFRGLQEFHGLRDQFLTSYTTCFGGK